MPSLLSIFLLFAISFLFILTLVFLGYMLFVDGSHKNQPIKGTVIARLDLPNRLFMIEEIRFKKRQILKSHKIIRKIRLKGWNKISLVTNFFTSAAARHFAEAFDKLEKGATSERVSFQHPSFNIKNRNVQYDFYFHKIFNSNYYIARINYNHITKYNQVLESRQVGEISRLAITKHEKPIKGFVAFNIEASMTHTTARFQELLTFRRASDRIAFLRYNSILILIVFANRNWQVHKMINQIKKQVESTYFANELKYLYDGSAVAISSKIKTAKDVNQTLQTLSFLSIYSRKMGIKFLSANTDIDYDMYKTYSQALRIFDHAIRDKSFDLKSASIRIIGNNKTIVDYYFPLVKSINKDLFSWIVSDMKNQVELDDALAEKVLFRTAQKPMMIDVNGTWLARNIAGVKNKKALVVIGFRNMPNRKNRIDLIRKVNASGIAFALRIRNYNDSIASLLKLAKPHFVLVDDNVWNKSKLLSSDHFMNLISLNALAIENKIKIIYKNPSLVLDEKIYSEIGLKYYFQT